MDYTLVHLIDSLESTLKVLKGDAKAQLMSALHDHDHLPDRKMVALASKAVNLLHETEQLLEPGPLVLADHFLGYINTKCLCAATELKIPDILHEGPKDLLALAAASRARPDRLRQVLRVLHNNGIFSYDSATETYSNNATSTLLLSNHWTQWHNWVELYGNTFYDMARGIPASCHEDAKRMAAQIEYDTDIDMFTYFDSQGWVPKLHKTLSGGAIAQAPGILEDYPWEEVATETIMDVGGGGGGLISLLLRKHKTMHGGIFDLETVIAHADSNFHSTNGQFSDVGERVSKESLISGDFLVQVPSFQVYTMKWCLHDWDDSKALKVMTNIRKAIIRGPNSRLIIMEALLSDGRMGRLSRYGDITMMVSANGQERTELEWRNLAKQTGWEVSKVYPLRNSWTSAIELLPDWNLSDGTDGTTQFDTTASLPDRVLSQMSFLEPWDASRDNPFYRSAPAPGFESMNFKWATQSVCIKDARPNKSKFNLDVHGFAFLDDADGGAPELLDLLRGNDKEMIKDLYHPHIEKLLKKVTGAHRIIIFDHTMRKKDPSKNKEENPDGKEQPATIVHVDQSPKGALRRLQQNINTDEDINEILKGRVQMINVWRPLRGPVLDWPLAMMDYQSLSPQNVHPTDLWRGEYEMRGQTVSISHTEDQEWHYLDQHRTDEVTLIKIWDSKNDVANMCPHAAFEHPDTPVDAPPRESVEVRCLVVFEGGGQD